MALTVKRIKTSPDMPKDVVLTIRPPTPRGLSDVGDAMNHLHKKPSLLKRSCISLCLLPIFLFAWTNRAFTFCKNCFGYTNRQVTLYEKLHSLAINGNEEHIRQFLESNATSKSAAGYFFSEFTYLPELYFYLPEILRGANVCLMNDRGLFFERWSAHPKAYKRFSSHNYKDDLCYAIGHILFWFDENGNTRFQFEHSPFRGFLSSVDHLGDYLKYKRDNEQQGITGTSKYTEEFCLEIQVDLEAFTKRISGRMF